MKNVKKVISLMLAVGLVASVLAGCGSKADDSSAASATAAPTTAAPTTAATVAPTQTADKVEYPKTVSIGYFTGADDNVLVKDNKWLEDELGKYGVTVKWINFQAGRDMNNALLAKSIDFTGGIGDPPVAIGVSTSIPYQVFWVSVILGDSEALVAKKDSNINSIKDLKGKKIATTVTSTSHYSLLGALELNGLSASDVQIVDLNPADIVAAWERGDIDAAYTWKPNLSILLKTGTQLTSSKELADQGYPTGGYDLVRTEFAEKYPQVVDAYIKALIKAHEQYQNDPDAAAAIWAKENGITAEEALVQAKGSVWLTPDQQLSSNYLGTSAQKGATVDSIKKIGDFLVDQKSLDKKLDKSVYEAYINPTYLENALK